MTLSELFELSPLGWEEAKRETIKMWDIKLWESCVQCDDKLSSCFIFRFSDNEEMWEDLHFENDTTLLKQWEAKQIELQRNK